MEEEGLSKQEIEELKDLEKLERIKKLAEAKKKKDRYNRKDLKKLRYIKEALEKSGQFYELNLIKELKEFNKTNNSKNLITFNSYLKTKGLVEITDFEKLVAQLDELEKFRKENQFNSLSNELYNISESKQINIKDVEPNIKDKEQKKSNDEWLRWLHQRYSEKFFKDNDRIWTVTTLFIPLSLAGLGSVKDGNTISTLLLAFGSISLVIFWYIICEKHRSFQERSEHIVRLIEEQIGIHTDVIKVSEPFHNINLKEIKNPSFDQYFQKYFNYIFVDFNIQKVRRFMLYSVIISWFVAVLFVSVNKELLMGYFFQINFNINISFKEIFERF